MVMILERVVQFLVAVIRGAPNSMFNRSPAKKWRKKTLGMYQLSQNWGDEAWSIGSVRDSDTEGSEFEPSFCHSFLCGGLWQDLVIPCVWDTTVIARR